MEKPITIAHVENHKQMRDLYGIRLREGGFAVTYVASNGREFLEQLEQRQDLPDVVLLDVNMPVMDGFETARQLTRDYPSIKILAYSTNDFTHRVEEILKCGAHGFITKGGGAIELKKALLAVYTGLPYIKQNESSIRHSNYRKAEYPKREVVTVVL